MIRCLTRYFFLNAFRLLLRCDDVLIVGGCSQASLAPGGDVDNLLVSEERGGNRCWRENAGFLDFGEDETSAVFQAPDVYDSVFGEREGALGSGHDFLDALESAVGFG